MIKNSGFTLIELLVVISIISLLSSVVLASLQNAREQAKYAKARADMRFIIEAAQLAQQNSGGVPLADITNDGCSGCPCRSQDIGDISDTSTCFQEMKSALQNIQAEAGPAYVELFSKVSRDPWGAPYLIDENETVSGGGLGSVKSAGPDNYTSGHLGGGDDIIMRIPSS